MSDVRRYDIDENGVCTHQLDGAFVSYDDYARLKAEVERLTKAGDLLAVHYTALSKCVTPNNAKSGSINDWTSVIDWNAAKEGKPGA